MSRYKVTLFLQHANMGASESWWSKDVSKEDLVLATNNLLMRRKALLTTETKFSGVRITEYQGDRRGSVYLPGTPKVPGAITALSIPAQGTIVAIGALDREDQWRAALQLRVRTVQGNSSIRYLAGIPDNVSATEPGSADSGTNGGWWVKLTSYTDQIVADQWALHPRTPQSAEPIYPIQSLVTKGAVGTIIGLVVDDFSPGLIVAGNRVQVRRSRPMVAGTTSLNCTYSVDSVARPAGAGTAIIYLRGTERADPAGYAALGDVQLVSYFFSTISTIEPLRVGIHQRGRPFGSPLGRAKRRRCFAH